MRRQTTRDKEECEQMTFPPLLLSVVYSISHTGEPEVTAHALVSLSRRLPSSLRVCHIRSIAFEV